MQKRFVLSGVSSPILTRSLVLMSLSKAKNPSFISGVDHFIHTNIIIPAGKEDIFQRTNFYGVVQKK